MASVCRPALFLDLDGTLLDIAPTAAEVRVSPDLVPALTRLAAGLDGALAILSGRTLAEIDAPLAPLILPAAAEHGAALRLPDGVREEIATPPPEDWITRLRAFAGSHAGVRIEVKHHGLVVHFRQAPDHEAATATFLAALLAAGDRGFEILPARRAFELRPRGVGKGNALRRLMQTAPFAGRVPVFVGDDVTDEEAIAAAQALGGRGLHVGRDFAASPAAVRAWVAGAAENPHILLGDG
ncbi:MAG: trehalose-phosphatase [Acetobacteraceae bacterium]